MDAQTHRNVDMFLRQIEHKLDISINNGIDLHRKSCSYCRK